MRSSNVGTRSAARARAAAQVDGAALDRRAFLRSGVLAAGGAALASPIAALLARQANAMGRPPGGNPYGPLVPARDRTTGLELLKLPRGFRYASFGWTGDPMTSGGVTPPAHDGMGVVATRGPGGREVVLVRNHEVTIGDLIGGGSAPAYDTASLAPGLGAGGGTTTLTFREGRWRTAIPSLAGTSRNCAGGPTPWGSWLTCEEVVADARPLGGRAHGFVFEVPAPSLGPASARPITDMGLFRHEAAAVDPVTGFVYETEDNGGSSGFYRYRPFDRSGHVGSLEAGGELDMLKVAGVAGADLTAPARGDTFDVEWVPVEAPGELPPGAVGELIYSGPSHPFLEGRDRGGARFARLEGCWTGRDVIYFVSTSGGPAGEGVVWAYEPPADEERGRGRLTALFVSSGEAAADNPDNITVSPRGGILVCEDGQNRPGTNTGVRLLGITRRGEAFELAVNNLLLDAPVPGHPQVPRGDFRGGEWAGATFDPTGRTLFANVQLPGVTFAIAGPWHRGPL